jgi:hypothetical protein
MITKHLKSLAFFTLFVSLQPLAAQERIPVDDETNLITYTGVVEVPKTTADTLYARLDKWFRKFYKNPTEVIKNRDDAKRNIEGQHRFKITKPDGQAKKGQEPNMVDAGMVLYSITITCREERFRYEITRFIWKQTTAFPAERWMDTEAKGYDPNYAGYLKQLDVYANEIIGNMEEFMSTKIILKDKDKW